MSASVRNAGIATSGDFQSRSATCATMRKPTTTRTGAAASDGTIATSGDRKVASRNATPVTTDARPVRAPSATPDVDST